jgi:DNA-binding IclR family transcriptional regulator
MDEPTSSDAVRRFLHDHIATVAQLEILLLLQTNPQQNWAPAKIAHELRAERSGTEQQLRLLEQHTLVKPDDAGAYHYQPATPELHAAAVAVAQAYLVRRVAVIEMIYSKPPDSLRAFSDAFRLRKDEPGGSSR